MGMVPVLDDPGGGLAAIGGEPERPPPDPSGIAIRDAAFRNGNALVSTLFHLNNGVLFKPVEGFNAVDYLKEQGSQYFYENHGWKFVNARSPDEVEAIKNQIRTEKRDEDTMHAAGAMGVVASMVAGTLSPEILLPGRVGISAIKEGLLFTRGAAEIGLAAGIGITASEAALHATQANRTFTESAVNVGTGTILMALLGGTAVKLLAKDGVLENVIRGTTQERQRMEMHASGRTTVPDQPAGPRPYEEGLPAPLKPGEYIPSAFMPGERAEPGAVRAPEPEPGAPVVSRETLPAEIDDNGAGRISASLSAAAEDTRQLRLMGAFGLEKMRDTPIAKVLNATLLEARRIGVDLAETALRFGGTVAERDAAGNLTGKFIRIAERAGEGPALERLAKIYQSQAQVAVGEKMDELWKDLRFQGEAAPYFARMRDWLGQLDRPAELPTYEEFSQLVARAMRRDDKSDIPQVQEAAQFIRQRVFEPWKQRAIEAGYFPKDIDTKTAESYLQRIWDKAAIKENNGEFINRVTRWLRGDQDTKAAIQGRVAWSSAQLKSWEQQVAKLESRLERLDVTRGKLAARFDERMQEVGRTEKRVGILDERAAEIADELTDIEEFIASARKEVSDPRIQERLDDMAKEASALRKLDRPMTEAQLRKIEEDELKGILADPTTRMAAEILTGRRKPPKAPSFLTWLVMSGGVKDEGGELLAAMGGTGRTRPGLINSKGRQWDELGGKLQSEFPEAFPERDIAGGGAPERNEIMGWIEDSLAGREPSWWLDAMTPEKKQLMDAGQLASAMDEALTRAGVQVNSIRDVAKILRDDARAPISLADLDRVTREMEAVGQDIPVTARRGAAEENLVVERQAIADLRAVIDRAMRDRARERTNLRVAGARTGEARFAEGQNKGRLALLDERMDRADRRRELIQDMLVSAGRERDTLRGAVEADVMRWEGKSAREGQSAIAQREKYATERAAKAQPGEELPRLTMADSAVDSTVRRILERKTDYTDAELESRAGEIRDRILGSPDGRLGYEESLGREPSFTTAGEPPRGPLAERPFNIPDAMVEDLFLENNIEHIVHSHLRTMVPDILLTERFGDPMMTPAMKRIETGYSELIRAAEAEGTDKGKKEAARLFAERDKVVQAIAGMRDRIRGTFGLDQFNALGTAGRVAQMAKNYNVISSMGMPVVTSLADLAGAVARYGFETVFREAYAPFFRMLAGDQVFKEATRQFKAMGIAVEMVTAQRHRAISDIIENYQPQSRLERTMQYGADKMQLLNFLAAWTDNSKVFVSIIASNEILRTAKAIAEGTKVSQRSLDNLADARISPAMAEKIWREFNREGAGEIINGTHLPNTDKWVAQDARLAFEGAVGREADIAVVTPGQEKYLWLSSPVLGVLGQFKSFQVAATTRILIANLQRSDAQALSGLIYAISLGMLSYKLNSVLGGQPTSDRPGDWIKEGISRSGVTGWFEEANALAGKMTRGKVDMYRLVGAEKPLSRYAGRGVLDQMLGPTAGKLDRLQRITGALSAGDWNEHDTHAVRQLTAYQNLFWLRSVLNQVEVGANNAFGIDMATPKPN